MRKSKIPCAPRCITLVVAMLLTQVSLAQEMVSNLVDTGEVDFNGHQTPYRIRHLPVTSFPQLPPPVTSELMHRGCLIPQTYQAHRPENVIQASLERAGSSDWAVLCSVKDKVTLLVFFGSDLSNPISLGWNYQTSRLQPHDATGELGFNWGIDPATPEVVHQAQSGLAGHQSRPDHDALADTTIDHGTVYRLYAQHSWNIIVTPN